MSKQFKLVSLAAVFLISTYQSTRAQNTYKGNPIVPDNIADPSIVKFGDTYYLYGTTDISNGLAKMGPPVVWKSKDFVNWSFRDTLLKGMDFNKGQIIPIVKV